MKIWWRTGLSMWVIAIAGSLVPMGVLAQEQTWVEHPGLEQAFTSRGINGCFVVRNLSKQEWVGWNQSRTQTRFIPASTFKIANSLIGLTVGAVKDVDEVLPYGSPDHSNTAWRQDMSLREAMKVSHVPVYRGLARRIGQAQMEEMVKALAYGNQNIGTQLDLFWLVGPLEISPIEQIEFLTRLIQETLPVPKEIQTAVKEILFLEEGPDWKLYAKTGWTTAPTPAIGWWVGWVEIGSETHVFALNLDIENPEQGHQRVPLGKACLATLGLLK